MNVLNSLILMVFVLLMSTKAYSSVSKEFLVEKNNLTRDSISPKQCRKLFFSEDPFSYILSELIKEKGSIPFSLETVNLITSEKFRQEIRELADFHIKINSLNKSMILQNSDHLFSILITKLNNDFSKKFNELLTYTLPLGLIKQDLNYLISRRIEDILEEKDLLEDIQSSNKRKFDKERKTLLESLFIPGSIDLSFDTEQGFEPKINVRAIHEQKSNGKILIGGNFTSYKGKQHYSLIRLNEDGNIDPDFNTGLGFEREVHVIQSQSDGKILVGGEFYTYNDMPHGRLVRLKENGEIDPDFITDQGFDTWINTIQIQSDGKILLGGLFNTYQEKSHGRIIRLNEDGSIDSTFNTGTGFNNEVNVIQIQSDGKILVGGKFVSYYSYRGGPYYKKLIRLNQNGDIDPDFKIGEGFDNNADVSSIQIQSDGKIIVGGSFTSYKGEQHNNLIRLNQNGDIDKGFIIGEGFNYMVSSIQIQNDGKIIIGGSFTSYKGEQHNKLIRLKENGDIDKSFNIGEGFNHWINSIQIQNDGKNILVGGGFSLFKEDHHMSLIRLILEL